MLLNNNLVLTTILLSCLLGIVPTASAINVTSIESQLNSDSKAENLTEYVRERLNQLGRVPPLSISADVDVYDIQKESVYFEPLEVEVSVIHIRMILAFSGGISTTSFAHPFETELTRYSRTFTAQSSDREILRVISNEINEFAFAYANESMGRCSNSGCLAIPNLLAVLSRASSTMACVMGDCMRLEVPYSVESRAILERRQKRLKERIDKQRGGQ